MTEYDYSPEAYERYLATQRRIASWVDQTENFRPQFANVFTPPPGYLPGQDSGARPSRPRHRSHRLHRSRSPSVDSSSSEEYSHGPHAPGPMPMRSAPGHLGTFPQHQLPFNKHAAAPMASPPVARPPSHRMPPSYYGTPKYDEVRRRRSQPPSPIGIPPGFPGPYPYPPPPMVLSPPVSAGVYGYSSAPPNYVMMSPPQPVGPMQVVYLR